MYLAKLAMVAWLMFMNIGHEVIKCDQAKIDTITPTKLFTKLDADAILGASTHITDSVPKNEGVKFTYLSGYKTDQKDQKSGKIGALYFFFEAYNNLDGARERFSDVLVSNEPHGARAVDHFGDEALYHTDNQNFDLMMVRKGRYVFSIKINKRTSTTRLDALKKVIKRIADQI
jgi:hypothetical protein